MIHVTELLDASVYDVQGHYVGRVRELCLVPTEQTNRIARLVIARGRYQPLVVRYDQVASAAPGSVRLNTGELALDTYHPDEGWLTVRKDVLDQQIIDLHGRKVVRVNDVDWSKSPSTATWSCASPKWTSVCTVPCGACSKASCLTTSYGSSRKDCPPAPFPGSLWT